MTTRPQLRRSGGDDVTVDSNGCKIRANYAVIVLLKSYFENELHFSIENANALYGRRVFPFRQTGQIPQNEVPRRQRAFEVGEPGASKERTSFGESGVLSGETETSSAIEP